jgi:hypothetical protein
MRQSNRRALSKWRRPPRQAVVLLCVRRLCDNSAAMNTRLLLWLFLFAASQIAFARHQDSDYKTGTLISWGAGGSNCSGVAVGTKSVGVASTTCNPGGDNLYRVTIEGHEYQLSLGDDSGGGILDKHPDPLRQLLPADKFQYRIDGKRAHMFVVEKNGKEAKYTIRGVQ